MKTHGSAILLLGSALATLACSGSYQVGFEGGPGGTPSGGSGSASGGSASGGSAPVVDEPVPAAGASVGGGTVDPGPQSRCGFAPAPAAAAPAPTASSAVILARIQQFLDDATAPLPDVIPLQPSADWAASQAKAILDGHVTNDTEAAGLVRFLTAWLNLQLPSGTKVTAAHTFAVKLAAPDATLSTLLAEPTGEPHRVGILSDPQFLTARPTITRRGVWIMKNLLCSEVPPPPPDIPASDPNAMGVTRREKLESAVDSPSCKACHNLSDPTGDALEHFDATGNYRELDAGQAVDSSATLQQPMQLSFAGIDELGSQLAVACPVAQCFSQAVLNDALSANKLVLDDAEASHVADAFADSGFSIRALVKAVVTSPTFLR